MQKKYLYKSMSLHVAVMLAMLINIPLFWLGKKTTVSQVPIIVDLKDVKISEMTNLPPKAKKGAEDKEASTRKRKEKSANATTPGAGDSSETEVKPSKDDGKKDFLVAPQPKKPQQKIKPTETKKAAEKTSDKKEDNKTPELGNPLKSLLASVNSIEKNLGKEPEVATISEETQVETMGIQGGTTGSYKQQLSISEIDAISGRLRSCWNLDPGAKGAQNMVIEIRAYLTSDARIKDVKILDTSRYNSDPFYRSVADSARRAVYICEDAYKIFADKYSDKYDLWKTMLLKFNPLDGNIN